MSALLPSATHAAVWTMAPTDDPVAFISIDDGYPGDPDNEAAAVLVESTGLAVTPFLTYYAASSGAYPPPTSGDGLAHIEYLRRFIGAGHPGVQAHSKKHTDLTTLSYDDQYAYINASKAWLARTDMFGPPAPVLFRPPYGVYNDDTLRAARANGFQVVLKWTHAVEDLDASSVVRRGEIVLCHFNADLHTHLALALDRITAAGLTPAWLADYVR